MTIYDERHGNRQETDRMSNNKQNVDLNFIHLLGLTFEFSPTFLIKASPIDIDIDTKTDAISEVSIEPALAGRTHRLRILWPPPTPG